ncbi:hypothetical protein IFU20_16550 [Pseudomonas viridiflava]|uniref:hypothetical protein n=1 Tax=Pseudomonas viridiflava TaxID=33069 RepID=UPI001784B983|nr:hypothetical protein [Pseudomonas viridiflava]MBD8187796.1 hypothetical protein [Pseudomonas viridiflava]MBV1813496.1 hypothetical protein [Pseudomonas viridiflava]
MKIGKTDSFDHRDIFDLRLEQLDKTRRAPESEKQAAINIYERLTTAKAILSAVLPETGIDTALLANVFDALGYEAESLAQKDDD